MNGAGGRCHDNTRCKSRWARLKEELLYNRHDTSNMSAETVNPSSGDTSSVIGITGAAALLMEDYHLWLRNNSTTTHYRMLHNSNNPEEKV